MIKNTFLIVILSGQLFMAAQPATENEPKTLVSPNQVVSVTLALNEKLEPNPTGKRLYYAVQYRGRDVLLDSPFGLDFKDSPPFARNLIIRDVRRNTVNETWQRVLGKRKTVVNHYNELTLILEEADIPHRQVELVIRAYDDGIALRYTLPEQKQWGDFKLAEERTTFRFPGNPTVWAANYGGFHSSQESEFNEMEMNELSPAEVYGCPLLVRVQPSLWAAITEANLTDWAGMHLTRAGDQRSTIVTTLAPRPDEPGVVVRSTAPRSSPWRVVMLGNRPGDLIESDIIQNLNDPVAIDVSWIHPGKSAWDWWSGRYAPEVDFEVGMNTETMKYYVDFAAEMGWEYHLVDAGWYKMIFPGANRNTTTPGRPVSDITATNPDLDLPELLRYAKEKNIKIIVWLFWSQCNEQMDIAFPLYEKWGISGVKIDFMDRDDQEMINFYHRTVRKAAEHHLLVDFHGAYKPTGWSRTYPNLITREGVMGNEYNKWSDRMTPDHCLTIPFTRGMLGAMDFTPGGFQQKTKETFRARNSGPFVMGTRTFQLAMLIVYESALQVVCDCPYNYRSSTAGTGFLKMVPTTWDDTRVIHGQVGDFITIARRSGNEWYVGSMTDREARTLEIPLDFLGTGKYEAEIWADAYEADEYPDRLMKQKEIVTSTDTLTARMAPGGGHVVHIKPIK